MASLPVRPSGAHQVLFHLGILDSPPPPWQEPKAFTDRVDVHPPLQSAFVAYLERKTGTCKPKTVTGMATRLVHFGRFLAEHDPDLTSLAGLDRQRHIEPYLNSVASAINSKNGEPITTADQARRILTLSVFLNDVTEWGWKDAPKRRLIFRTDSPRLPRPLPRYLPVDADRRLGEALARSDFRLAADALLLARACGLRIGELLDLELDCVHEIPGNGAWLKVPLGKLDTEQMVPLDDESVTLIDRICATRSEGRPLPAPSHRPTCAVPLHPPRPTIGPTGPATRTQPGRPGGRHRSRQTSSAQAYVRHCHGECRGVAAGTHGSPRSRLSRDEPSLWSALRHHGAREYERALELPSPSSESCLLDTLASP